MSLSSAMVWMSRIPAANCRTSGGSCWKANSIHREVSMFESLFHSFASVGDANESRERVAALRAELKQRGLDGFVVPRADEHQNEYVPASVERLLWLTGFSGSAGLALVLMDRAAIFVDGRYTLAVPEQVDVGVFEPQHLIDEPPTAWIEKHLKAGAKLGYDPWLHTPAAVERLMQAAT